MLYGERAIKASFGGLAAQAHYGYIIEKFIHREQLSNIFESGWVIFFRHKVQDESWGQSRSRMEKRVECACLFACPAGCWSSYGRPGPQSGPLSRAPAESGIDSQWFGWPGGGLLVPVPILQISRQLRFATTLRCQLGDAGVPNGNSVL